MSGIQLGLAGNLSLCCNLGLLGKNSKKVPKYSKYVRLVNLKHNICVFVGASWHTKIASIFLWGKFSLQSIIFFLFVLTFSLLQRSWSENAGGSWAGQFCQFLTKTPLRYLSTVTNNLLWEKKTLRCQSLPLQRNCADSPHPPQWCPGETGEGPMATAWGMATAAPVIPLGTMAIALAAGMASSTTRGGEGAG